MAEPEGILRVSLRLSVVLAALDDYSVVEQVHRCLEAQSIRESLELVVVCRSKADLALPSGFERDFADIVLIEAGESTLLNEARAIGVRQVSTPYVLILEDHCLPFADCLEWMLNRLDEGWSAVGPAFVSGNTVSRVGIAANLLTYGEWMGWSAGGERRFVAGYNSAFATEILLARGSLLSDDLITPSTLQMSLASEGHRFYFEARALMAHWESSSYRGVWQILAKNGRGLGMRRACQWSLPEKAFFSLMTPMLMAFRVARASRTWWRSRQGSMRVLVQLLPLSMLWTTGELRGYWCRNRLAAIRGVSEVERNRQIFVDSTVEPIRKLY